jgi:hypothetical protein
VEKCSENNLLFAPPKIVSDFEESIYIGAKTIWPEIQILECKFHLTHNWWKHIQSWLIYIKIHTQLYCIELNSYYNFIKF